MSYCTLSLPNLSVFKSRFFWYLFIVCLLFFFRFFFLFLLLFFFFIFFFFFQAEDGIRDWSVTGVQTCALPIFFAAVSALWRIYQKALTAAKSDPKKQGEFIKEIMSDPELRAIGKSAAE